MKNYRKTSFTLSMTLFIGFICLDIVLENKSDSNLANWFFIGLFTGLIGQTFFLYKNKF